jgi:hypothetical protein
MESILTSNTSVHINTKRRKGNRGPTKKELQRRVNDLERRVREGEEHNIANAKRIGHLEKELATQRGELATEQGRVSNLQILQKRIFFVLGDALRTGTFTDQDGYHSLRGREDDCVLTARSLESQSLPTPPTSNGSQRSSTTPIRDDPNIPRGEEAIQDAYRQAACQDASLQSSYDSSSEPDAIQAHIRGRDSNIHNKDDYLGDKLISRLSTAQPLCASGHEVSSADPGPTTDAQGVGVGIESAPPMVWVPAGTDFQSSMFDTASGQGDAFEFQDFDIQGLDFDGFVAEDHQQNHQFIFHGNAIPGAPDFPMTQDNQMQGVRP